MPIDEEIRATMTAILEEIKKISLILEEAVRHGKKPRRNIAPVAKFAPPDVLEVAAYASSIKFKLNAQAFLDFYQSKGWVIGKSPMKDWRAAVRTWKRNERGNAYAPHGSTSIHEQASKRHRQNETSDLRKIASPREVLAGLGNLPDVPLETRPNPGT